MAQQDINIGPADAKTGDSLFSSFTKIQDNTTELYADVATNTSKLAYTTRTYWFDDNDTATTTTPISHAGGATDTYLTNDGLGTFTNQYNPSNNDRLWDSTTNKFNLSSLKIGDTIEFRGDIKYDTTASNQEIAVLFSLAEGTAAPYELNIDRIYTKSISTGNAATFLFRIYIGDETTRTGSARFRVSSLDNASFIVNGWFYQITEV